MKTNFHGVLTALVSPFKDGDLDEESFVRLLHHQMDQGVQGFVIGGTTGESPTLRIEELHTLFKIAKAEVGGKVPLVVGTGTNSTEATCEMSREVSRWQPDGILVVVPYYNKPPQRGLRDHFLQVSRSVNVPVLLYTVPSRTITTLEPQTIAELSKEKNIVGLKEASGDMNVLSQIKSLVNGEFTLLSGDDGTCVDFCARGGHGVISVSSHIIGKEMVEYIQNKKTDEYSKKYSELMRLLFIEINPIPVKMALHWMGILSSPELRLPLSTLDEKFHKDFKACLKNLGKI